MSLETLENQVIQWGVERGIAFSGNSEKQALKMVEEVGELCRAILKDDKEGIIDGIGDSLVTIIILAYQYGYDLEYCLQTAYNVIKDRTGRTVDGTFIKADDL